ncbi:type II toxin-antitoxin system ParD family antitoxin [Methylorubrum extorquens]|uniref:Putative addiction module antidote protein, CopG/Arc/MetJ family n=1 Tax=Methylorubrum extorquens (strain CM4 / NCIMB 13688) TaxID=440085 RepID=B7KUQ7_METC4|nr:type II toxin-antitoxin system ParD family antitoxin [Methylorubrum extorquens]ACK84286.1 putative addiction module antidote protein, CopG/Arc/MetJ family [Methylorubrum extorquens CM4]MBA9067880.1 antitoxin ParD1/3/4 [Methylobacterium sp. RAS18]MCP1537571.1 antitoxin ParD1/3/4 [Methylorubrum extorquens]
MPSSADLGTRLESYVTSLVKEGRYRSRSEVLREGVRLVEEREKRLSLLDAALARGAADADANRVTPAEDVRARLIAKYEKLAGPDA